MGGDVKEFFGAVRNNTLRNILVIGLVGGVIFGTMRLSPEKDDVGMGVLAPDDVAAAPGDAIMADSGLASKVLKEGTGKVKPVVTDEVTVHYTGWEASGRMFDSSLKRGQPATFHVSGVIQGWVEGLQLMVVGEKRRFWIPAHLAYGETPQRAGVPSGMLCFDVELLDIKGGVEESGSEGEFVVPDLSKMPEVPANVGEAPDDAVESEGGVKSVVLIAGSGVHPGDGDVILVHYTAWDSGGKVIDSSFLRGESVAVPLRNTEPAVSAGLQLMRVGEKRQFWVPVEYIMGKDLEPGAPVGMLCYQFELIKILPKER